MEVATLEKKVDQAFDGTTAVRVISPQYRNLVWYYTHSAGTEPWTEEEMKLVDDELCQHITGYETNHWVLHKFSWGFNAQKITWDVSSYGGSLDEVVQKIHDYYTRKD